MRRALATAVAAVLLLAGCDDAPDEPDTSPDPSSGATSSETADPGPVVECPSFTQEKDPALPDAVPDDATSVRLCDGGDNKVTPPVAALTTDVMSVVAAVNGERPVRRGCVDLRIPEYQLAFGYPDGSRFVVAGRFTGCAELLVGSGRRARAMPPLRTFVEALRTQLAATTPPEQSVGADDLDCAQQPSRVPVFPPTDLDVAALCFGLPDRPDRAHQVTIPDDDLTTLVRSMQADTSSSEGALDCAVFARKEYWIVGVNAWGDPITAHKGCFGLQVEGPEEWTPRGAARAILRQLVSEAR
jgi:hypothetical protein